MANKLLIVPDEPDAAEAEPPVVVEGVSGPAPALPSEPPEPATTDDADEITVEHELEAVSLAPAPPSEPTEPTELLFRWTDAFDAEHAMSLWVGLASAADPEARAGALSRWVEWTGAVVPADVRVAALADAAHGVLDALDAIAREPAKITAYEGARRHAITRAMRAWIRAREDDPAAVLGGVRAVLRSEALGGVAPSPPSERAILSNVLRRNIERLGAVEALPMLHAVMQLDAASNVFAPFTEGVLDFLLLEGEVHGAYGRELAEMAALPAWANTVRLGLSGVGRSALRAARLLCALAGHPEVAQSLPADAAGDAVSALARALAHGRFAVWSRAARALGRLAGSLPGASTELAGLLEPSTSVTLRRRAHAALGSLRPTAGGDFALLSRRDAMVAGAAEPWLFAALALGLADAAEDDPARWSETARGYAARGGPETWASIAVSLREIAARGPIGQSTSARSIAGELRRLAEQHKSASPSDGELVERTLALVGRMSTADDDDAGGAEITPWFLLNELARRVAHDPRDETIAGALEELTAHTDNAVANALRAVSQDNARVAARAGIVLEEVVDLLVDGDLGVVAERIADNGRRGVALGYTDALRKKVLRAVWTGLRRPTPATATWRRWLLRTATVLPRVEPADVEGATAREAVVREQVLDTLARIADDPSITQPALQRYVIAALGELADTLRGTLGDTATLTVLVWMAVRNATLPLHARTRRALEAVPTEQIDRLYRLVEQLARSAPAGGREVLELGALAGPRCRLGTALTTLGRELEALSARGPEAHWSGLPKLDLVEVARVADELKRVREDATHGLLLDAADDNTTAGESLVDRASKLNRSLTSTSLKFVDATRRAEIVEQYVSELSVLCEAIATACGPVAGTPVRAQLAKSLVAVRTLAAEVVKDRGGDVRYIARLKVLGTLASAHEGGMASTYLAEGPAPGKRVVVKLLPWERFAGASADVARELFEKEMQLIAPIVHPNVVSIIDAGFVDEGAYIALEHIPGASMETLLRKLERIDVRRLGPIIRDTARGLACLHARGIVHRDIKPGNILVQLENIDGAAAITPETWATAHFVRSVVIDLGVATEARTGAGGEAGLTGTAGYLAPEIARGLDLITPAIDVYALAVVVFESLTGSNPFLEGDPELATVVVRHGTMLLPLEQLPEEAQRPGLLHLLADCSRLDPRARPTMRDFLARWSFALK